MFSTMSCMPTSLYARVPGRDEIGEHALDPAVRRVDVVELLQEAPEGRDVLGLLDHLAGEHELGLLVVDERHQLRRDLQRRALAVVDEREDLGHRHGARSGSASAACDQSIAVESFQKSCLACSNKRSSRGMPSSIAARKRSNDMGAPPTDRRVIFQHRSGSRRCQGRRRRSQPGPSPSGSRPSGIRSSAERAPARPRARPP